MMDYAGRVAKADTYPKLLRLNAKEHGGEIALREKDFGLWKVFTWKDYQARVHDFALGMVELGLGHGDVVGRVRQQHAGPIAVDADGLGDALRWERSRNDELFPHLYGELDLGAVNGVLSMRARSDGYHDIPELEP